MVKKKVLVTGGSGYLGARLCLHLANEGYAVTSLCHSKIPSDENWISKMDKLVVGDVRDESLLMELAEYKYDVLVHLVSLDHNQSNGAPSLVSTVNITPVWSLLDIFSKQGLGKFIYFSTAQTYGTLQNEVVTENRSLNTQNAYGLTHHIGEVICEHYNRTTAVDCCVIRLSNSYGAPLFEENNCWWLVVNDLCQMAYRKKEITLQSDGSPLRDFIHGWDVCSGLQTVIETNDKHLIYNLSSGKTLSILDIAEKVKEVYLERYGIELSITKAKSENNTAKKTAYKIDNSLILGIGFEPKWTLGMGINDLFDFLEKKGTA
nr:NAD(P)-dependent oxidoreductase [uncultured Flavobacterium sp.]